MAGNPPQPPGEKGKPPDQLFNQGDGGRPETSNPRSSPKPLLDRPRLSPNMLRYEEHSHSQDQSEGQGGTNCLFPPLVGGPSQGHHSIGDYSYSGNDNHPPTFYPYHSPNSHPPVPHPPPGPPPMTLPPHWNPRKYHIRPSYSRYGQASGSYRQASGKYGQASGSYGHASGSSGQASSSHGQASSSYEQASSSSGHASGSNGQASSSSGHASDSCGQASGSRGRVNGSFQAHGNYGYCQGGNGFSDYAAAGPSTSDVMPSTSGVRPSTSGVRLPPPYLPGRPRQSMHRRDSDHPPSGEMDRMHGNQLPDINHNVRGTDSSTSGHTSRRGDQDNLPRSKSGHMSSKTKKNSVRHAEPIQVMPNNNGHIPKDAYQNGCSDGSGPSGCAFRNDSWKTPTSSTSIRRVFVTEAPPTFPRRQDMQKTTNWHAVREAVCISRTPTPAIAMNHAERQTPTVATHTSRGINLLSPTLPVFMVQTQQPIPSTSGISRQSQKDKSDTDAKSDTRVASPGSPRRLRFLKSERKASEVEKDPKQNRTDEETLEKNSNSKLEEEAEVADEPEKDGPSGTTIDQEESDGLFTETIKILSLDTEGEYSFLFYEGLDPNLEMEMMTEEEKQEFLVQAGKEGKLLSRLRSVGSLTDQPGPSSTAEPDPEATAEAGTQTTAEPDPAATAEASTEATAERNTVTTAEPNTATTAEPNTATTAEPNTATAEPNTATTAEPNTATTTEPNTAATAEADQADNTMSDIDTIYSYGTSEDEQ